MTSANWPIRRFRRHAQLFGLLCILGLVAQCQSAPRNAVYQGDADGERFLSNGDGTIYLSSLDGSCSLTLEEGEASLLKLSRG